MSKIIFNEYQSRQIRSESKCRISIRSMLFNIHAEFKVQAVQENLTGKGPFKSLKKMDLI